MVKYGGSFMDSPDPAVRQGVARDLVFLEAVGINPVAGTGAGRRSPARWRSSRAESGICQRMRITDECAPRWLSGCCRRRSIRRL